MQWQNRAQFFGAAAQVMRRILVDHARQHNAAKRGGGEHKITLSEETAFAEARDVNLLELDEVLNKLAKIYPQKATIVELRYFSGLSIKETAAVMKISEDKVISQWRTAKAWLHREINKK
jgi:RNA polymerase sigma factor (TIGR02999 family)